jgi:hypothetical protein
MKRTLKKGLNFGAAHCPSDGLDPASLIELAEERLERVLKSI